MPQLPPKDCTSLHCHIGGWDFNMNFAVKGDTNSVSVTDTNVGDEYEKWNES